MDIYNFDDQEPESPSGIKYFLSRAWRTLINIFHSIIHFVINGFNRLLSFLPNKQERLNNRRNTNVYDPDTALTEFPEEYVTVSSVTAKEIYHPPLNPGLAIHIGSFLIIGSAFVYTFTTATSQDAGNYFLLYLLISFIFLIPLPVIVYRGYALLRASYKINREGLLIRWGLRSEDIPLKDIEWIEKQSDLDDILQLPMLSLPGAIIGTRKHEDYGTIEFMASDKDNLLLVGTSKKIYAISPEDPQDFLHIYQRAIELGSLYPIEARSNYPAIYLRQFWQDRKARIPLITGFSITLLLFILVSIIIPSKESISLGFDPSGIPHTAGPSETLLLLPILAGFTFFFDLLAGLFFYRSENTKTIAYVLWISTSILPITLLVSLIFLI